MVVGFVVWVESTDGDGKGPVDRVAPRMGTDGVALFDRRGHPRTDDWTTNLRRFCTPSEGDRFDSTLVRVSCRGKYVSGR